ncbi:MULTISPECIES: hypothetical protein [Clostridia]|uniref:hypothetical protein n=1 Tax=Clostridia TaxID=186801 RepID=UPI000E4ACC1C|nr:MULTISPECIES: hypothetical protein [Clostridia]RHV64961.1 hypothetical protein DXB15_15145 [Roseburia sp. OM02-15]
MILKRRCQLALTRITHQVSRAFDLNLGFPIWFAPESLWWVMPVVEVLVLALSIFWVREKATPKKKS